MTPQKLSPNWYWNELGFTIFRDGLIRTIFDKKGSEVCHRASYETELGISRWLYDNQSKQQDLFE